MAEDDLPTLTAPTPIYRLGRGPDPWEWPDWAYAHPDGTFGNRWDDPKSVYRVLYACSERLGTFVETLSRFRRDAVLEAGLAGIQTESPDDVGLLPGQVPESWLEPRRVGSAAVQGEFAEIGNARWLANLHSALAPRLVHYAIDELDAAAIRLSAPRRFTQEVSREVFERSEGGARIYEGIAYLSRLGDELHNWAIFEPTELETLVANDITKHDADLLTALEILDLTLVSA